MEKPYKNEKTDPQYQQSERELKNIEQSSNIPEESPEEEEKKEVEITSNHHLWEQGITMLKSRGIAVNPASTPEGVSIRILTNPKKFKGYNPPDNFRFYCPSSISPVSPLSYIDSIIKEWWSLGLKNLAKFWSPLTNPTRQATDLRDYADYYLRELSAKEASKSANFLDNVTLTQKSEAYRFFPAKSWFNEKVQALTAQEIVPFFYPVELDFLMLQLGRVIVGRDQSTTIESCRISHTFRNFIIIIGKDAGMGKSTLMDYLLDGLMQCGYEMACIHDNERFGWGEIVRSDVAYLDDLIETSQRKFITSANTKQSVSNGLLSTERKGVDPITLRSKTTMIACSNSYNPTDFYEMDEGLISRCKLLYSLNNAELTERRASFPSGVLQESPNLKIRNHWAYLSEVTDSEPLTLALYFLHLCANKFLEETGYYWDYPEGDTHKEFGFYNQRMIDLHETIRIWGNGLQIQSGKNDSQHLMAIAFFFQVFGQTLVDYIDSPVMHDSVDISPHDLDLLKEITSEIKNNYCYQINKQLDIGVVLHLIASACLVYERKENNDRVNQFISTLEFVTEKNVKEADKNTLYNPLVFLNRINIDSVTKTTRKIPEYARFTVLEAEICKFFFNNIRTVQGFKLGGEISWLHTYWHELMTYKNFYRDLSFEIIDSSLTDSDNVLLSLKDLLNTFLDLTSMANNYTNRIFHPDTIPFITVNNIRK